MSVKVKKKLIEVALPLKAINTASAREKSIRHGHPSTLHLWWARRPLAAARAVIFAQMVDDPSGYPEIFKTEEEQDVERQRLFRIIEELVKWENTTNEIVLQYARDEIWKSWRHTCTENINHPRADELFDTNKLPSFHDPFAGGGTLPLEAQRLGLESYASDLNPVAVLINKAMIEIPPKFADNLPVNPDEEKNRDLAGREWNGTQGLADDVRYYGQWVRDEAEKRIGHHYPKVEITAKMTAKRPDLKKYEGQNLTVIAWLWARTVKSPNPAFATIDVPLASNFMLCTKEGKEVYVEPVIEGSSYRFTIKLGKPKDTVKVKKGTKLARGSFGCIFSDAPIPYQYVDDEANSGRMGVRLMGVVAAGDRERVHLDPAVEMETIALTAKPLWKPDAPSRGTWASNAQGRSYGFRTFGDYFTSRQLTALTNFSGLIEEVRQEVKRDAKKAGLVDDGKALEQDGTGATAYADAIAVYLAFALDKVADRGSSLGRWDPTPTQSGIINTFSRQAISMTWDFAESNPLGKASGNFVSAVELVAKALRAVSTKTPGFVGQEDAGTQLISTDKLISTDPPYYDNIGYADLSDFFYAWLRRALKPIFPALFTTVAVPKAEELVACSYRHGGKVEAATFFLDGMTQAMHRLAEQAHPAFPVTIYYAFKQAETSNLDGTTNTGWDTFLGAIITAGFAISGTWPMRTELANKLIGINANILSSSIILVCRQRAINAPTATRREFVAALKAELPEALAHLQAGNVAPVDLAQAAIGPGMAVYTRYTNVLDAEGKPLPVRAALALINQILDEALAEQEGDFDADTRWALTWFEQLGFDTGPAGEAILLTTAKGTALNSLEQSGIVESGSGSVRLLKSTELAINWDPTTDIHITVWKIVHQLICVLEASGEGAASALVTKLGSQAEIARELCYRLYTLCERKKRATEAMAYNGLVQSWPEIIRLAQESPESSGPGTVDLFEKE